MHHTQKLNGKNNLESDETMRDNWNRLQKNGMRVTLGDKPVKFSKKVYIGDEVPKYA